MPKDGIKEPFLMMFYGHVIIVKQFHFASAVPLFFGDANSTWWIYEIFLLLFRVIKKNYFLAVEEELVIQKKKNVADKTAKLYALSCSKIAWNKTICIMVLSWGQKPFLILKCRSNGKSLFKYSITTFFPWLMELFPSKIFFLSEALREVCFFTAYSKWFIFILSRFKIHRHVEYVKVIVFLLNLIATDSNQWTISVGEF